jgi:hypothetical protein
MYQNIKNGAPVWIAIAGRRAPGIVEDATIAPRDIPVRDGRIIHLPESVIVFSLREVPATGVTFYLQRAENTGFVFHRSTEHAIDKMTAAEKEEALLESALALQASRVEDREAVA